MNNFKPEKLALMHYDSIDMERRLRLLELVERERMKIIEASAITKINYSTAKTIIQNTGPAQAGLCLEHSGAHESS